MTCKSLCVYRHHRQGTLVCGSSVSVRRSQGTTQRPRPCVLDQPRHRFDHLVAAYSISSRRRRTSSSQGGEHGREAAASAAAAVARLSRVGSALGMEKRGASSRRNSGVGVGVGNTRSKGSKRYSTQVGVEPHLSI